MDHIVIRNKELIASRYVQKTKKHRADLSIIIMAFIVDLKVLKRSFFFKEKKNQNSGDKSIVLGAHN